MKHDDGTVTGEALDRLLAALDDNRERAGERYLLLRRKLASFFDWRGASFPDECADRVLNVTARRLAEGEVVHNVSSYCAGVARMILLETRREQDRERAAFKEMSSSSPREPSAAEGDRVQLFEQCLDALPAESRELILTYYRGEGAARVAARRALAERLGIPLNALRIRACRIRARLEESVRALMMRGTD